MPPDDAKSVLLVALEYRQARLSFIPIRADGSKQPAVDSWDPFKVDLPTEQQTRHWFVNGRVCGLAVVTGRVSGQLEMLDFDKEADDVFPQWQALVREEAPGLLERLTINKSPRGYHAAYRSAGPVEGNTKLAWEDVVKRSADGQPEKDPSGQVKAERRLLIETRGEGGYFLVPGCPPACHPDHKLYVHHAGPPLVDIQTITAEERDFLRRCCRSFHRDVAPDLRQARQEQAHRNNGRGRPAPGELSPGDDFDQRGPTWQEILGAHGWVMTRGGGDHGYCKRPDKVERGHSATAGFCKGKAGEPLLFVFSSSAHPFEPGKAYGKFNAYTLLSHNGDHSAAARELAGKGFGKRSSGQGAPATAKKKPTYKQLPPFRSFPLEHLPWPLDIYVRTAAQAIGCDPALVAPHVLAAAAGSIGISRALLLKKGWAEHAIIWAVTVADSGGQKTPAYRKAVDPLTEIQIDLIDQHERDKEDYERKLAEWEAKPKQERDNAGKPELPSEPSTFITSDTTIEKLGELLQDNPRGVLVARDELDAWFQSFTRYRGKGGGTDRAQWLELHSAGTLRVDRMTRERPRVAIRKAAASVCGTIQSGVLAQVFDKDAMQAGLAPRFLLSMPPRRRRFWTEMELHEDLANAYQALLVTLLGLPLENRERRRPHVLGMSLTARRLWIDFYDEWAGVQYEAEGEQASKFAKIEAYVPRLALVHHVVSHVARDENDLASVAERSIQAGIGLARWFADEALRVYRILRESEDERHTRALIEWIQTRGGRVTVRQLQQSNSRKWPTSAEAEEALNNLVQDGFGRWEEDTQNHRGGHRAKWFVLTLPTFDTSDTCQDQTSDTCSYGCSGEDSTDSTGSAPNGSSTSTNSIFTVEAAEQVSEVSDVGSGNGAADPLNVQEQASEPSVGATPEGMPSWYDPANEGRGDAWEGNN